MAHLIVSRTPFDVVTVAQASAHLRLWDEAENEYVQSLIDAAVDVAERYMNRLVIESTVIVERSDLDLPLPLGRASDVTEITYFRPDDEERVTLPAEAYSLNAITNKLLIKKAYRHLLATEKATDFQISYTVGWQDGQVPDSVKQGILLLVGSMYEMREDATVGQGVTVTTVPITHQYLFNKHKLYAV